MQLPSEDELVLTSGCHPIRAKKARYYEDRQLQSRIVPAPAPPHGTDTGGEADPLSRRGDDQWAEAIVAPAKKIEDLDNAGVRREPELPDHEEIVSEPRKPTREFELPEDDHQEASPDLRILQRQTRTLAWQVALDPGDRMDL